MADSKSILNHEKDCVLVRTRRPRKGFGLLPVCTVIVPALQTDEEHDTYIEEHRVGS
jgi:hypothetical protein